MSSGHGLQYGRRFGFDTEENQAGPEAPAEASPPIQKILITSEPYKRQQNLGLVLDTEALRPPTFTSEPYKRQQPLGLVLDTAEVRGEFTSEPYKKQQPLGLALDAVEIRPTFEAMEPRRTRPYVDSLDPVIVGSAFRTRTMEASKLDVTTTLPILVPFPGDLVAPGGTIFIPCGDRIPEIGDAFEPGYSLPPLPNLDDSKTFITVNGVTTYLAGSQQNSWTVTSTPNDINGFDYLMTPPALLNPGLNTVTVTLSDNTGAVFTDSYTFLLPSDFVGPIVIPIDPTLSQVSVLVTSNITIQITDAAEVVLNTVLVRIERNTGEGFQTAFVGADVTKFKIGYDGPGSTWSQPVLTEFNIVIDPIDNFDNEADVTVEVTAEDPFGNPETL